MHGTTRNIHSTSIQGILVEWETMLPNHSPWIHQLNRVRPVTELNEDLRADTVIVGGGIAGIMTAYFTLHDTNRSVLLLEADKVAHGATGHNAGQLTTYFERGFASLVEEFGLRLASEGVRMVEETWTLIDRVVSEAQLTTPIHRFTGYAGVCTQTQLVEHLEDNRLRLSGGLPAERIIVAREWEQLSSIPEQYKELYEIAPQADLRALLETENTDYIAVLATQKGCANSALLAEEIVGYLLTAFPERFRLHEGTVVREVELNAEGGVLKTAHHTITASRIVLATNGFENFTIRNYAGADIDTAFHHSVRGLIGYMAGYLEQSAANPTAISYYPNSEVRSDDAMGDDYFYLTRRPYEHEGSSAWSLVCAGGPDKELPSLALYSRTHGCNEEKRDDINDFLASEYRSYPKDGTAYAFCWHGLMGYTPNLVRRVGVEPHNPVLLYNLGCNGVGLLPSIMGGERIARILLGEHLAPSIFDPGRSGADSV